MGFHFPNPGDIVRQVEGGVNHLKDEAVGQINHVKDQANSELNHIKDTATGELNHIKDTIVNEIQHLAEQAKNDIENVSKTALQNAENALKNAISHVSLELFEKALKDASDFIKKYPILPSDLQLQVSVLTLDIGDLDQKVEDIHDACDKGLKNKQDILDFVKAISPSSLQVSISGEILTDVISAGVSIQYSSEQIITIVDSVLSEAGIN